jgi:succinate dehydrogenase hydrophobic anchor subunit
MWTWGAEAVQSAASGAALTVGLSAVLAVHLCVGSKSLLEDLGIDRRYKTAFRVIVCVLAALFALSAIVAVVL